MSGPTAARAGIPRRRKRRAGLRWRPWSRLARPREDRRRRRGAHRQRPFRGLQGTGHPGGVSADQRQQAAPANALRLFFAEVLVHHATPTHTEFQFGGFSSPASQPTASVCIGSTAKRTTSVRSQVEHSKVRSSNPRGPGEMRANAIRCLHTGHIGRSLVEAAIPEIPTADHTPSAAGVFNIRARRTFRGRQRERARSARVGPAGSRASAACVAPPQAPKRRGSECRARPKRQHIDALAADTARALKVGADRDRTC